MLKGPRPGRGRQLSRRESGMKGGGSTITRGSTPARGSRLTGDSSLEAAHSLKTAHMLDSRDFMKSTELRLPNSLVQGTEHIFPSRPGHKHTSAL